MRLIRFHTPEMGPVGHTRWFKDGEDLPKFNWKKVTAIETSEEMTVDDFKTRFPEIVLPE